MARAVVGGARALVTAALVAALLRAAAALGCKLRCHHANCTEVTRGAGVMLPEQQYQVESNSIFIKYKNSDYITVMCNEFSALDSPAMPSVDSRDCRVKKITLVGCPMPHNNRSLADVLEALNVTLVSSLLDETGGHLVLEALPLVPPLSDYHFLGLEGLFTLEIAAHWDETVRPEPGFLKPLKNLQKLKMRQVTLPPGELDTLPKLDSLNLEHADVERLSTSLLSSNLRSLTIKSETRLNNIAVPLELVNLDLGSPAVNFTLDAVPVLSSLILRGWTELIPKPLTRCANLTSLYLISPAMADLPKNWLTKCSRLEKLKLQYAKSLTSLPLKLLENVNALTELSFNNCALETLPIDLLDYAPRLRMLYFKENNLSTLPGGLFTFSKDLRVLNLSSNDLNSKVFDVLASLNVLTVLNLASNPRISYLCEQNGNSLMHKLRSLEKLILRSTGVNQICLDWRTNMLKLKILDLRKTNVKELWFEELQFESKATVLLQGAPVTTVGMTRNQYNEAKINARSVTSVQIDSQLKCDCDMYWTRRALVESHAFKHINKMDCAGGKPLKDMASEDMVCPDEGSDEGECAGAALPPACECNWRSVEDSGSSARLVRVNCTGRGLEHVPRPAVLPGRYYELLLSHNNITQLHADDLQPNITKVDLRNNFLTKMDGDTVSKLRSFEGLLQLANNSLDCSCSSAAFVRALNRRAANLTDRELVRCAGGGFLNTAASEDCMSLTNWLACGLVVLLALAIIIILFFSSRERRFFLKAVLHRWGCLWYGAVSEGDRDRLYDAFITFSHKDEPKVLELMARLEPTYRLCVHRRDWIPGRYITEQIAESVATSRRTIALVSSHYQESGWALAEFHLAHAVAIREAKPRLVVVLLDDPSVLQLDDELRGYLATNTYVRWEDSCFWEKLAASLPRPRPNNATSASQLTPDARFPATPTTAAVAASIIQKTPAPVSKRMPTSAYAYAAPLSLSIPAADPGGVTVTPAAPIISATLVNGSTRKLSEKRLPLDTRVLILPVHDVTMQCMTPELRAMTSASRNVMSVVLPDVIPT